MDVHPALAAEKPVQDLLQLNYITLALLAIAVVVAFIVLMGVLRRRKTPPAAVLPPQGIDISLLESHGPPQGGLQLECYGAPVRVAAMILAPMGTGGGFPSSEQLPDVIDRAVPGMSEIIVRDRPVVHIWPPQLSPQGFANSYFAACRLPGDRGKQTPWCSIAGRYLDSEVRLLIGMILCASSPNSLGEFTLEQPTQWMDILRIRRAG